MLTEIRSVFIRLQRIVNYQRILPQSVLHRRHSCGWKSTAMILSIKGTSNTCNGMEGLYNELQICLQLLKQDLKIKTVLFIYSKLLQNYIVYGQVICSVNAYGRCCC